MGEYITMYCTNCGAEISSDQRYCYKCGTPIDPGVINVDNSQPQPEPVPGFDPKKTQFQTVSQPQAKKVKSWPIIAICIAGLLTVSLVGGFLFVTVRDFFRNPRLPNIHFSGGNDENGFSYNFDYDFDYDFDSDFDEDFDRYFDDYFDFSQFEDFEEFYQDSDGHSYYESYSYNEYQYATAYAYNESMYLEGRKVIKDSTVIYGDKTIGSFCDYIDSEVLGNGEKIDRTLLYSLLEVHLVDDSLYKGAENRDYFKQTMLHCLQFVKEFSDMDIVFEGCSYYQDEPSTYYYDLRVGGESDTWIVDYSKGEVSFDYGSTDYHPTGDSSMFDETAKKSWIYVIEKFFDI